MKYTLLTGAYHSDEHGDSVASLVELTTEDIAKILKCKEILDQYITQDLPFTSDGIHFKNLGIAVRFIVDYNKLTAGTKFEDEFDSCSEEVLYIAEPKATEFEDCNSGFIRLQVHKDGVCFTGYSDYENYETMFIGYNDLKKVMSETVKLQSKYSEGIIQL